MVLYVVEVVCCDVGVCDCVWLCVCEVVWLDGGYVVWYCVVVGVFVVVF